MNPNCQSSTPVPHQVTKPELQEEILPVTAHLIHRHHGIVIGLLKQTPKALERKIALHLSKIILRVQKKSILKKKNNSD
uniref:Uncharacterized protein n=1 Tax=Piliocolobus tephrosceles TaxID=591936 RepID=A0A8C9HV01_9PRIM